VPSFRRFARSFGHSVPAGETDFMRKLLLFFMGMIVGAGLVSFAFKYHVMYSKDGLVVIPKSQASLSDLYVDVRNWKPADWQAHPDFVHSLVAHGRSDLIAAPANDFLQDLSRKMEKAERPDQDSRLD
jgi:hypothetical protein